MDDVMSFLIEAEERGLLTSVSLPRVVPPEPDKPRRGKKAARAKREKAKP